LGITGCRHSATAFLMPTVFDLSYFHLSRLPVRRIRRHTDATTKE
jgi:hypothetical protein